MSMKHKRFSQLLPILAAIFTFAAFAGAQQIEADIKIESVSPPVARVKGRVLTDNKNKNWFFLHSIAGIENLGERISDFTLTDQNDRAVAVKRLVGGEYLAEETAVNFSYKIDLSAPKKYSALAHVSWLAGDQGLLMLDDLLPQFGPNIGAKITFQMPDGWRAAGNEKSLGPNSFEAADIEKAVFIVGKNWGANKSAVKTGIVNFVFSGEFLFSTADAAAASGEILSEYQGIFGAMPKKDPLIFILKFPGDVKNGGWEAETRGASVVILSSDMPFKNQSVQRLHEQLRHELFHLWVPNDLALSGDYDWFYEGFALYQSLRTGVALNRIRFEDFLDALARAYDLDNMQSQRTSLIEASKNRWSGANSQIYARGMLVAFLSDAALLRESRGKRSLTDIFRALYEKHRKPNLPQDGNESILNVLESRAELQSIVERYIRGAENLRWQIDLESLGLETSGENFPSKLVVKAKLSGRQKDLLNELGYNNWRKLSRQSK